MADETPKLHIDTDWKAQAQAEKERLAMEEAEREQKRGPAGKPGEMPPADFRSLVGLLASQAMMGLGMFADQKSGRVIIDLEGARFNIDLLGVIEEKTKGNLAAEEADELKHILAELRQRYVQISELVAQQMATQAAGDAAASAGESAAGRKTPPLKMPDQ